VTAKRLLLVLAGLVFVGIVALAIGVFVLLPRYIESEVKRQAAERGVELEVGSLEFGWQWVTLHDTKARLTGVSVLSLHFDKVAVELDGSKLVGLTLEGVEAKAQGSLPNVALEIGAWSKRFPNAYALPLTATGISAAWRPNPIEEPWLLLSGGSLAKASAGTAFAAEKARVAGADIGRVGATYSATATSVALGFGETELAKAPLRLDAEQTPRPKVTLTLAPVPLERMAGPFAMALPVKNVVGSGSVTFDFASRDSTIPTGGHARLELEGYIPPHPVELDGFVFGDVTTLETDLRFGAKYDEVALENTSVTAGKFVLKGSGNITRQAEAARVTLDLKGALPCDALASAAAESRLGRLLGRTAGRKGGIAALRLVGGSVTVRVQIDASTANLPDAKVVRSIGIGCGLKPLTLQDLRELGEQLFAGDLSKLPEELGKLIPPGPLPIPSRLPPIPSGFPSSFPSSFRFPTSPPPTARPSASSR
jgi:ADP-dependent NAD(P)H-hydrate dehydratase / NAD(P)H-hydrate epimerase